MRIAPAVLSLLMSLASASTPAFAEQLDKIALSFPSGDDLSSGELYVISYQCIPRQSSPTQQSSFLQVLSGLLPFTDTTQTFGFFLFKGAPKTAPNGNFSGDGAFGVEHVFTIDKKQSSSSFENTHCRGVYIVNGKDAPNVLAFYSTSKAAQTKILAATATFVSSSIGPLFSLFSGGAATALLSISQAAITNSKSVVDNYATFLSAFDSTKDQSRVVPLRTGHLTIGTDQASVEMDITPIQTLLIVNGVPFRDSLDVILSKQIDFTSVLADDEKLQGKCTGLAAEWINAGVSDPLDQAYVLVHAIMPANPSKKQILRCLGRERAVAALPRLTLFRIPHELFFNLHEINDMYGDPTVSERFGQQPQGWPQLGTTAKLLITDLNRLGSGVALPASAKAKFEQALSERLTVEDETFDFFVQHQLDPNSTDNVFEDSAPSLVAKLVDKGFKRWGCYVQTDADITLKSPMNEALVMVAWLTEGDPAKPVVARVFFDGDRRISGLVMDDGDPVAVVKKSGCTPPVPGPAQVASN